MAFLRSRGKKNIYHIYWYDSQTKNIKSKSTKTSNKREATSKLKIFEAKFHLGIDKKDSELIPVYKSTTIQEAFNLFIETRKTQDRSVHTISHYENVFNDFLNSTDKRYLIDFNKEDYFNYLSYLNKDRTINTKGTKKKLSQNSKANYIRHLFAFFKWLKDNDYIEKNIIDKLKLENKTPRPIEISDLNLLLEELKNHNKIYYDAVKLIYLCAYRISEFISAELKDFDIENNIVYVKNSKANNLNDSIPMLKDIKEHIEQIDQKVFGYWKSPDGMKSFWKRAIDKLNLRFSFHALRKARGTELANNGANPYFLKEFMRHSELKTTLNYYVKINKDKARKQLDSVLTNSELV